MKKNFITKPLYKRISRQIKLLVYTTENKAYSAYDLAQKLCVPILYFYNQKHDSSINYS